MISFFFQLKHLLRVSKEPSHWDGSFEHTKHMFRMGKKIITISRSILLFKGVSGRKFWILVYSCPWRVLYPTTHDGGVVLYYTFGVCPSVRAHHFRSIAWVFIHGISSILVWGEWYGIVNGQNTSILTEFLSLLLLEKMVSGLLFLYCLWHLNEISQICFTSKVTYYD